MATTKLFAFRHTISFVTIVTVTVFCAKLAGYEQAAARGELPLKLVQTIPLPSVTSGMNHLDADAKRQRFFVTAPGQQKVIVVDLSAGNVLRELTVPAAAARYLSDLDQLCVAGHSGVSFFDGESLVPNGNVDVGGSVDELQYDPTEKKLFVGVMESAKPAIAVIDVPRRKLLTQIKLPARPQGFVLETKGKRIFANTPGNEQVTVVDREQQSIVAEWKLAGARSNFPIAIDETSKRVFVACRKPAKLFALDSSSGNSVGSIEIGGDADDMAYDADSHRIYVICGSGVISTIEEVAPNTFRKLPDIETAEDVRNAQFSGSLKTLFVAVPAHNGKEAELRAYQPNNSTSANDQTK